jgi:predicted RNase H-like HicB family nuclease
MNMKSRLTLQYWQDGVFFVGRLLEVPEVFSQGETLSELRTNIQDAYELMITQQRTSAPPTAQQELVEIEV